MILGISGKAGSGKDTVGKIIQYFLNKNISSFYTIEQWLQEGDGRYMRYDQWRIKKFATKVKEICSLLTGIPVEDFEKEEVKSSYLGEEWTIERKEIVTPLLKPRFYVRGNGDEVPDGWYEAGITRSLVGGRLAVRELLQKVGTDAMRDVIHPDVWVNALMKDYYPEKRNYFNNHKLVKKFDVNGKLLKESLLVRSDNELYPKWLITDVRFPNEAKGIKDRGGIVVRVNKPRIIRRHTSFKDYTDEVFDSNKQHHVDLLKGELIAHPEHESETALDDYVFDYVIENDSDIPSLIEKVRQMLIHFKILE